MNLGALAQLVEQRTFNPFVVGSTPAGPTKFEAPDFSVRRFFYWCVSKAYPIDGIFTTATLDAIRSDDAIRSRLDGCYLPLPCGFLPCFLHGEQ
jgi:hypothetical protein